MRTWNSRGNLASSVRLGGQGIRRRDGAIRWGVFQDAATPGRHLESFLVDSWAEHLRQHERVTLADREIEDRVKRYHRGPEPPRVNHFLAAP